MRVCGGAKTAAVAALVVVLSSGAARATDLVPPPATVRDFPALIFTKSELDSYASRKRQQIAGWTFLGLTVASLATGIISTFVVVDATSALRSQVVPIDTIRRWQLLDTAYAGRASATVSFGFSALSAILWGVFGTGSQCKTGQAGCL